ncbi:MAG: dihydroxy-acid dehydratase [Methanosphaera sp.]|uniref:dihydroxy-acid dehydratase n=2 Tax=Methanosphaera sp. TaxID=2666342 RepID=UPI002E76DE78|nr:dihydroxy-acid dehydratase [Methanosphaera sp.]MEE1117207.1 dihydroxy-acid dehydratase [Methanosphaera sp.]MEE3324115.1 dihydroxy-acid dehydratase [Methanosphaera sp.]MEE3418263.1 dihydroxy-acid dehydratase [Methanosphaera sp.]
MRSDNIKKGINRTSHRSLLRACGLNDEDMEKPFIGIANSYTDIVPGHIHLKDLVQDVKEVIRSEGGVPFEFNTMAVCDGIAMNHEGMYFSLPSREIIANTVESMAMAHQFDALICMPTCDKVVPGMLMAAARLDIPTIFITGGPMMPGKFHGEVVDFINVTEAVGATQSGKMSEEDLYELERCACPGAGSCAGLFTANTMACLTETLGMSLPGCATAHAVSDKKVDIARKSAKAIFGLIEKDIKPSDVMTQESFENAIVVDLALGGSTNTTLHIPAIAHEVGGLDVNIDLFDKLSHEVPYICSIRPGGNNRMIDVDNAGGIPAVMKNLESLLHTDCVTCTSKTVEENLTEVTDIDYDVIHTIDSPVRTEGGIAVLYGNIAPNGSVIKQGAVNEDMLVHSGPCKVYNSEEECVTAIENDEIVDGDVVVIRYEGPKGGPGMREMLNPTAAIMGRELFHVALITDGRFSGGSRGPCIGHISPEAAAGGPIAAIENGDIVSINVKERSIKLELTDDEIQERLSKVKPVERNLKGWLRQYQQLATSADKGGILK